MNIPLQHTFSSITKFETCPRQWAEVRLFKNFQDEMGEAAKLGDAGHKELEAYLKEGTPFSSAWQWTQSYADQLKQALKGMYIGIELKLAVDRTGAACDYYSDSQWIRGKADLAAFDPATKQGYIFDFKFGKRKPSEQLRLYAAMALMQYPDLEKVNYRFLWMKEPAANDSGVVKRDADLAKVWQTFQHKIGAIEHAAAAGVFPPKPSGLCKNYCPVKSCEHNGKR